LSIIIQRTYKIFSSRRKQSHSLKSKAANTNLHTDRAENTSKHTMMCSKGSRERSVVKCHSYDWMNEFIWTSDVRRHRFD